MQSKSSTISNLASAIVFLVVAIFVLKPIFQDKIDGFFEPPPNENGEKVLISQILADFQKNELSANAKYNEKTYDITGIVFNIEKDPSESSVSNIILSDGLVGVGLYARIHNAKLNQLTNLEKGTIITVTCKKFKPYGISAAFNNCANPRAFPLNGKRADLVWDELVAKSNPYLTGKTNTEPMTSENSSASNTQDKEFEKALAEGYKKAGCNSIEEYRHAIEENNSGCTELLEKRKKEGS